MFWLLAAIVGCFALGAFLGAPFLPARKQDIEAALDLAEVKAGDTVIDLGAGDRRLLVAAGKRAAQGIGYEINPLVWIWSLAIAWPHRKQVQLHLGNFWTAQLPEADVIYTFLIHRYTKRLDRKLASELQHPTKVVSYVFELPRKAVKQTPNTWLYRYP